MKQLITILVLIALIMLLKANGSVAQDSTRRISRRNAVQLALKNNLVLENSRLEIEKSEHNREEAKSKLYPQVEGYSDFLYSYSIPRMAIPGEILGQEGSVPVEFGTTYDWSIGLRATQMVFNKSYFTSLKATEKMVRLNELSLKKQEEEIIGQVIQVYDLCKTTEYQLAQMRLSLQNMDTLLHIAQIQLENQVIRPVDRSRIQMDKNNLQNQVDQLILLLDQQLDLLKYLTGIHAQDSLVLTDTLQANPGLRADVFSADARTEIQLLDQQIDLAHLNIKMNNQNYLPSLSMSINHFYQGMRDEFDFFEGGGDRFFNAGIIGLHVTVPVFDGFAKREKRQQQQINLVQLQNNRQNTRDFLNKEHVNALEQYHKSQKAYQRQQENIVLAEENYQINLMGYRENVTGLTDLLLAESSLTEVRVSYYNALLQLKNAELNLVKLSGRLAEHFSIADASNK